MSEILLRTNPVTKIVVLFIAGLIFASYITIPIKIVYLVTVAFIIISLGVVWVTKKHLLIVDFLIALAIFFVANIRYQMASGILPQNHISQFVGSKKNIIIEGYISNHPVNKDSVIQCEITTEYIQISDSARISTCGNILLICKFFNQKMKKGDYLKFVGDLKKPRGERNPGEFDYQKYLKQAGIYGITYINQPSDISLLAVKKKTWLLDRVISSSREYLEQMIDGVFYDQNRALLKGLILGKRSEITPEIKEAFSNLGVMHILAVSGLHVGYIVLIFFTLFKILRFPFRVTIFLTMGSIVFYMFIIGFKPPVVRASIIAELYFLGVLLQRRSTPLNLIATAALIILLINPLELFQSSFQLSFIAVLSIIYFYKKFNNYFAKLQLFNKIRNTRIGNYLGELFLVSVAVSCGTLPLIIYYFEKLPLLAIFINILVVPLAGIIIAVGFLFMSLTAFTLPLAKFFAFINIWLLNLLIYLVTKLAQLPFSCISIYGMNLFHIIITYIFLFLLLNMDKKQYRKAFIFLILIGLNGVIWLKTTSATKWMEVIYLDVGQGDAAIIKLPNENNIILIDGGKYYDHFDAGERHVAPYLRRRGFKKLDAVIISHGDIDHVGGVPYILRNFQVERIIDNGIEANYDIFRTFQFLADSLQLKHEVVRAGDRISVFNNYGLFVLHPDSTYQYDNLNNSSLVIKIIYGDVSFLFTGDIEKEVEKRLLDYGDLLESDVLKIPHHGGATSSTSKFLELVNPKYAVISVGEYNPFDHPAKSVLRRLDYLGIETIRTDINGAVIFRTDGKRLKRIR